jgi:hypothetical protein
VRSGGAFSDDEENKTCGSTGETLYLYDPSPNQDRRHSLNDFMTKINKDFDTRKAYEETVLRILNAHSTEKMTNPASSETFS